MGDFMDDLINENGEAVEAASNAAGEYLASINKHDLASITGEEWLTFLKVIIKNYNNNAVPF